MTKTSEIKLEGRFIDVNGQRHHYVVSTVPVDSNPPVVLIHGIGLSHRYLLPLAVRLADEFKVYAPDQLGFGMTDKPKQILSLSELSDGLVDWMDAMHLERVALVGNSVGCQVIVDLAARYPDRVSRAVLQGPTTDPGANTFHQQGWRWIICKQREEGKHGPIPVWQTGHNGHEAHRRDVPPVTIQDYLDCGIVRLLKTFADALEQNMVELLPRIQCPTLVVRGTRDPIVPQRWAEEITELLPRGRLVLLPGVVHTANVEAPLEFMRVIRPFLLEERKSAPQTKQSLQAAQR